MTRVPRPAAAATPKLLSSRQAATLFRVGPATVRRWIRQGKLPGFRTPGACGHYRVREDDALAALAGE